MVGITIFEDKIQHLNFDYSCLIRYKAYSYTWCFRGYSSEFHSSYDDYTILRVFNRGSWLIYACNSRDFNFDKALTSIRSEATITYSLPVRELKEAYVVKDKKIMDKGSIDDKLKFEVFKLMEEIYENICRRIASEIIVEYSYVEKEFIDSDGRRIIEGIPRVLITLYTHASNMTYSSSFGFSSSIEHIFKIRFDEVFWSIPLRLKLILRRYVFAKPTLIVLRKHDCIFAPEVSSALIHECIGHLLQADKYMMSGVRRLPLHVKIASEELTVYDNPLIIGGFGSYYYDDEGIPARRKCLVEDGILIDYLHNRATASFYNSDSIGNGRGLGHPPICLHSNLQVKPGDWKVDEMMEEVREGFLLVGLIEGKSDGGKVILEVENGIYIKDGEPKYITGPLLVYGSRQGLLHSIRGLGRKLYPKPGYEKGLPICEYAPFMLLSKVGLTPYFAV